MHKREGEKQRKIILKNILINVKYMLFGMGTKERYFISPEHRA